MKLRNLESQAYNIADDIWSKDIRDLDYYFYTDSSVLPPHESEKDLDKVLGGQIDEDAKYEKYESYEVPDFKLVGWLDEQGVISSKKEVKGEGGTVKAYRCGINWDRLHMLVKYDEEQKVNVKIAFEDVVLLDDGTVYINTKPGSRITFKGQLQFDLFETMLRLQQKPSNKNKYIPIQDITNNLKNPHLNLDNTKREVNRKIRKLDLIISKNGESYKIDRLSS